MKAISPGTVTVGVLAIVCGLVGVYVAKRAMEPEPVVTLKAPPKVRVQPGPEVIYARVNLPAKTRITLRDLREKRLAPGEEPPAGSVSSEAELIGRITRESIRANSVMLDDLMYDIDEGPDPSEMIPAGYVAVPITATGNRANKSLIRMGSHVNVAATHETDELELGYVSTKTILKNALVIATSRDDFERASPTLSTREIARINRERNEEDQITLAVPQAEANLLITAQKYGSLSVTLVGFDGQTDGDDQVVTATDIFPVPLPEPPPIVVNHVDPPLPPATYKVERWNGNSLEIIELPNRAVIEAKNATVQDQIRARNRTVPVNIKTP